MTIHGPRVNRSLPVAALLLAAAGLLAAVACSGQSTRSQATTATSGGEEASEEQVEGAQTLNVRLQEWSLQVEQKALFAGQVAFLVTNAGQEPHELLVLRTDLPAVGLPVHGGQVGRGDGWKVVGEVDAVQPGRSAAAVFDLSRGHYVLICDLAGHYERGMHAEIVVQ